MKKHYKWHRWLGVTLGLFLLVQTITGAIWIGPFPFGPPLRELPPKALPDAADVLPPIHIAARHGPARSVRLRYLLDDLVYEVQPTAGRPFLVDARTGAPVEVDPATASRLAGRELAVDAEVADVEEREDGALRVHFDDGAATHVDVDPVGTVGWAQNRYTVGREFLISLHDWAIVERTTGSFRLQRYGLILVSALALVAILSGYNLWYRRRRNKRAARG